MNSYSLPENWYMFMPENPANDPLWFFIEKDYQFSYTLVATTQELIRVTQLPNWEKLYWDFIVYSRESKQQTTVFTHLVNCDLHKSLRSIIPKHNYIKTTYNSDTLVKHLTWLCI